ncbi:hypothetical protein ACIBF1_42095 [Spirillospora sp. NPDC050679]
MNDDELGIMSDDHHPGGPSDAEADLLRLTELRGIMAAVRERRWSEVKTAYQRAQALAGPSDDPLIRTIGLLADQVSTIESALERAAARRPGARRDRGTESGPGRPPCALELSGA